MFTKDGIDISNEIFNANIQRLTNQLWKIIPMRENNEPWLKQLDTVIIEIVGLNEMFSSTPQFLQLLSKLKGLYALGDETDFLLFRKTVFEALGLLQRLKDVRN